MALADTEDHGPRTRPFHGHTHGHDEDGAAPLRRGLLAIVVVIGVLGLVAMAVWWPRGEDPSLFADDDRQYVDATVTAVELTEC